MGGGIGSRISLEDDGHAAAEVKAKLEDQLKNM